MSYQESFPISSFLSGPPLRVFIGSRNATGRSFLPTIKLNDSRPTDPFLFEKRLKILVRSIAKLSKQKDENVSRKDLSNIEFSHEELIRTSSWLEKN